MLLVPLLRAVLPAVSQRAPKVAGRVLIVTAPDAAGGLLASSGYDFVSWLSSCGRATNNGEQRAGLNRRSWKTTVRCSPLSLEV
jgi:hypothetical protein